MSKILIDEATVKLALEALEMYLLETNSQFQRKAITAIKEALAQPQQEPVAFEPNDADLLEAFTRSNNGPNPFYRCNICGDTEPGVREYLVAHWLKHNTSPPQRTCAGCDKITKP